MVANKKKSNNNKNKIHSQYYSRPKKKIGNIGPLNTHQMLAWVGCFGLIIVAFGLMYLESAVWKIVFGPLSLYVSPILLLIGYSALVIIFLKPHYFDRANS